MSVNHINCIKKKAHKKFVFYRQPKMKPIQHFLFGYGSLINPISRFQTLCIETRAIPVIVKGYHRTWSYQCPIKQYTAVEVEYVKDKAIECNGVLIHLQNAPEFLKKLDKRERFYKRSQMNPLSIRPWKGHVDHTEFQAIQQENSIIWVYERNQDVKQSILDSCPIPQTYLDCILSGCCLYGRDFAMEFLKTTFGWNQNTWINDRFMNSKISLSHKLEFNLDLFDSLLRHYMTIND